MSSFASLHGGLLVRKGEAAPSASKPVIVRGNAYDPFAAQRRDVVQAEPSPAVRPARPDPAPGEREVRATLRLTREQLRRLRLASAMLEQSQQDLLSRALDARLDELSEGPLRNCRCFRRGGGTAVDGCSRGGEGC